MRTAIYRLLAPGVILAPLIGFTGCVHHEHDHDRAHELYISEAPPRERIGVRGVAPSPDHAWINGHYVREGNRWEWAPGRWEGRPHRGAEWVEGRWDHRSNGYVWVEGRWR